MNEAHEDLCVAKVPLFQSLSRAEQYAVAAVASPARMERGEQLDARGAAGSQLTVVHSGAVKVVRLDSEGREQVLRVLGPGDFIGESAFLTGRPTNHFTVALEASSMCVFRHEQLGRLIGQHPSIALRMLQEVSQRLAQTEARLAAVISGDVTSRLASYLLGLPARRTPEGLRIELPLAKKDIASLLDTTPESFSRQLRRLQDFGIVTSGRGRLLTIVDVDALIELADPA